MLPARIAAKIQKTDSCWLWTANKDRQGYGRLTIGGRRAALAHRVVYELVVGGIPAGMDMDHLCRVRCCVNPAHLEPVTHKENMLRGAGVGSMNAAKTHCDNGHAYDATNTYRRPDGTRDCRECIRQRVRKYKSSRKQAAA